MRNLHKLANLYTFSVAVNVISLYIAARVYAESFSLLMDPISWLGKVFTDDGSANTGAFLILTVTMFLNALIWKEILSLLSRSNVWKIPVVRFLGRAVLVGFILLAFPCDKFVGIHSIGGAFVVGGLWGLCTIVLYRVKVLLNSRSYMIMWYLLHISAIFCGINFVLDSALKGFSQRPLLMAIIMITGICLHIQLRSRFEPDFAYNRSKLLRDH